MPQPETHRCEKCFLVFTGTAEEIESAIVFHEVRHDDFDDYGERRNRWTPADKKWLAQGGMKLPDEEAA